MMKEILTGVFHWSTFHEGIGEKVHSHLVTAVEPAVLIDPREPAEGLEWFRDHGPPAHVLLTNRHHYRHSDRFAEVYGTTVRCHGAGLHEFARGEKVDAFEHGETLPGGVEAMKVGALCPEETAFFIPVSGGLLFLGDALIRVHSELAFVPDELMGDDPAGVKRGLRSALENLLERDFRHLLLAHGAPQIDDGKSKLRRFVESLAP